MYDSTICGVTILTADVLHTPHAFSTRLGGVSTGIFESLNLGSTRGDDPENVQENWRRFGAVAGIPTKRFVHGRQVHGNVVRVATPADAHGIYEKAPWEGADGFVTNIPGLPLAIFTADCAPLLMHDPVSGVVAAVHCGWRGTVSDIEGEAVRAMQALGSRPEDIHAAVGACIGPCCFETGPEVLQAVEKLLSGDAAGLYAPKTGTPGKFLVDLPNVIVRRLCQMGLAPEHMETSDECTCCRPERYWSHRACAGVRGSQANLIML